MSKNDAADKHKDYDKIDGTLSAELAKLCTLDSTTFRHEVILDCDALLCIMVHVIRTKILKSMYDVGIQASKSQSVITLPYYYYGGGGAISHLVSPCEFPQLICDLGESTTFDDSTTFDEFLSLSERQRFNITPKNVKIWSLHEQQQNMELISNTDVILRVLPYHPITNLVQQYALIDGMETRDVFSAVYEQETVDRSSRTTPAGLDRLAIKINAITMFICLQGSYASGPSRQGSITTSGPFVQPTVPFVALVCGLGGVETARRIVIFDIWDTPTKYREWFKDLSPYSLSKMCMGTVPSSCNGSITTVPLERAAAEIFGSNFDTWPFPVHVVITFVCHPLSGMEQYATISFRTEILTVWDRSCNL